MDFKTKLKIALLVLSMLLTAAAPIALAEGLRQGEPVLGYIATALFILGSAAAVVVRELKGKTPDAVDEIGGEVLPKDAPETPPPPMQNKPS